MFCLKDLVPKDIEGPALVMLGEIEWCSEWHHLVEHVVFRRGETDRELVCEFHDLILNENEGMSRPLVPETQVTLGGWIF